jgi:hypothetical protein
MARACESEMRFSSIRCNCISPQKEFRLCLHARARVLHRSSKAIGEACDRLAQCHAITGMARYMGMSRYDTGRCHVMIQGDVTL